MGLAATQVRLLQLTARQHSIEYQAQRIQAQKLQLANESDMVYNAYMNALDSKKIQYRHIEDDGSISYKDATYNKMFTYQGGADNQYALQVISGPDKDKFLVTAAVKGKYKGYTNYESVSDDDLKKKFPSITISDDNREEYQKKYRAEEFADAMGAKEEAAVDYYSNLYMLLINNQCEDDDIISFNTTDYGDSYEWLTNAIENGQVSLHKFEPEGGDDFSGAWAEVSLSTDTMLAEVADEKELKKAEATYEAETTRIERKDSQYDTLLSQTETERNAVKTEMEELKQIRTDNIEKNFKLFS